MTTNFLSFKTAKDTDLWWFVCADSAGGLLDDDDVSLAYFTVKCGRRISTDNGSTFRIPTYDDLHGQWEKVPYRVD